MCIINSVDNDIKAVLIKALDDAKFQDVFYLVALDNLEILIMLHTSMRPYQVESLMS